MAWLFYLMLGVVLSLVIQQIYQRCLQINKKMEEFINKNQNVKTILVLIAHPDDESMFFLPLIESLKKYFKIRILCFSNGDSAGLGKVREQELRSVAQYLGISDLKIIENGYLRDGMREQWDTHLIMKIIEEYYYDMRVEVIVTFDNYGVSGHPNHRAVSAGARDFLKRITSKAKNDETPKLFELTSVNILRKYIGILDVMFCDQEKELTFLNFNVVRNWNAMQLHLSQFVWFRKLFVFFSRYSFINTLREI